MRTWWTIRANSKTPPAVVKTKQIFEVQEFVENPATGDTSPEVGSYLGLIGEALGTMSGRRGLLSPSCCSQANQPIVRSLVTSIVTILVFAMLAGALGIVVARRLAAPLIDLSNTATEVASGNLAIEAKVAGPAEIAQVASTFNTMTSSLRELFSNLERLSRTARKHWLPPQK
jgi:HAMP domain-containing protein